LRSWLHHYKFNLKRAPWLPLQQKSPMELASQSVPEEVGGSCGAPLISSSATKHKKLPAMGNQKRHMVAKRAETTQKK